MDYVGGLARSIKRKCINYWVGNLAISGYYNCLQIAIIAVTGISYGINITRDMDYVGGLARSIKLQGSNDATYISNNR